MFGTSCHFLEVRSWHLDTSAFGVLLGDRTLIRPAERGYGLLGDRTSIRPAERGYSVTGRRFAPGIVLEGSVRWGLESTLWRGDLGVCMRVARDEGRGARGEEVMEKEK
jgi:hypothetical protein